MNATAITTEIERAVFSLEEYQSETKSWETLGLESRRRLSDNDRRLAQSLRDIGTKIEILELPEGVCVKANSRVGHVAFDGFELVVLPKFEALAREERNWSPLAVLLAYAFGLKDLRIVGMRYSPKTFFADILVQWLLEETRNIQRRGLFQQYRKQRKDLSVLRGKIDFTTWLRRGAVPAETMPCVFHRRSFDNPLNQTLCAGLRRAAALAKSSALKSECCLLADTFAMYVTERKLEQHLLSGAYRAMNRLNAHYENAVKIVQMLLNGSGGFIHGPQDNVQTRIPGFFFDMNDLFERAVANFLRENLPDDKYDVLSQKHSHMATAQTDQKTFRLIGIPDIIVETKGTVPARRIVLDTKYFTITPRNTPTDQLAMYALTCSDHGDEQRYRSTILFPDQCQSDNHAPTPPWDVFVHRYDENRDKPICKITVRPVDMPTMIKLVKNGNSEQKKQFALELIGDQSQ